MVDKETGGHIDKTVVNDNVDAKSTEDFVIQSTTTAIDVFQKCIKRAENLISIHDTTLEFKEITEEHYCDCYRAAIVLSISALDAYIRKIVVSQILSLISGSNDINKKLREYLKQILNQDKLLDAARQSNLNEVVEKAIKEDFEKKSFQGEWKISTFMGLIGHPNIFSEICRETDKNEEILKKSINQYTTRRHIIAHRGDYDFTQSTQQENTINKSYAEQCIKDIKFFVKITNKIITK